MYRYYAGTIQLFTLFASQNSVSAHPIIFYYPHFKNPHSRKVLDYYLKIVIGIYKRII